MTKGCADEGGMMGAKTRFPAFLKRGKGKGKPKKPPAEGSKMQAAMLEGGR